MADRVFTVGTFDLFHYGHVRLLERCTRLGDEVWVGINTDEFVERYKGSSPTLTFAERAEVVNACQFVNGIVENDSPDARSLIDHVSPRVLAIGSDWARKDYYAQMGFTQDWLDERDIVLAYVPYTRGISTTELRWRLCDSR